MSPPAPARSGTQPSSARAKLLGGDGIIWHVVTQFLAHRSLSLAASVTYYALMAIFPALAALVAVYSVFGDPAAIDTQLQSLGAILPGGALQIVGDQIKALTAQPAASISIAFFGGLIVALWSASSGVKALFDALNILYDEPERRGFVKLAAIALLFTIGGGVFLVLALSATVAVPAAINLLGFPHSLALALSLARWVILVFAAELAFAVIYRFGPDRRHPRWRWISWGSAVACLLWLLVSAAFSWYAANFGHFNATYGSLGAVIGLMTWLWLSFAIVLVGAQIDAVLDHRDRDGGEADTHPPR